MCVDFSSLPQIVVLIKEWEYEYATFLRALLYHKKLGAAMKFNVFKVSVFFIISLYSKICFAQNTVVVIPLIEEIPPEPYASLAEPSPQNSAYTISDDFVGDSITGLIWQRSVRDDISWYDAWDYCQGSTAGRKRDWRLPSIKELTSIADYGAYNPALNPIAFPQPNSGNCWAENTQAASATNAWIVDATNGVVGLDFKSSNVGRFVRCVRGKFLYYGNFEDNRNGTATDLATGLTWQQQDDDVLREWIDAHGYCKNLILGGKIDWRLPTIKELQSIVDYRNTEPSISPIFFPGTNSQRYWSGTSNALSNPFKWVVSFNSGGTDTLLETTTAFVRCVRSN